MKMGRLVLLVGLGLLLTWPARAQLLMDASSAGVTGNATTAGHVGWNILSQHANRGTNPNDPAGGPPVVGLEDFRTLRVVKEIDGGSAKLRELLVQPAGPPISTVVIEQLVQGTPCGGLGGLAVQTIELTNARVVEVKGVSDASGVPAELVSFGFEKIEWTYRRCDQQGGGTETTTRGWDLVLHKEI